MPAALLQSEALAEGVPRLGLLAAVRAATTLPDGTLLIDYELERRVKLLSVWQTEPYQARPGQRPASAPRLTAAAC
jgi:hypothetical protein